jgi:hypothetical protein
MTPGSDTPLAGADGCKGGWVFVSRLDEHEVAPRFEIANCDPKDHGVQHIDASSCAVLECLQDGLAAAVVKQTVLVIGRIGV